MHFHRALLAACLLAAGTTSPVGNLLPNGGFETRSGWSTATIHHPERVSFDCGCAAAGRMSLRMDGRGKPIFMLTQAAVRECAPGTEYAVRAARRATSGQGHVYVAIREFGPDKARTTLTLGRGGARRLGEWEYLSGTFVSRQNTQRVAVFLYNINSRGVAWFDDITVAPVAGGVSPFELRCRRIAAPPVVDGVAREWQVSDVAEDVMLIGPHGVGKTSLGRALAKELGIPFHDEIGWRLANDPAFRSSVTHASDAQDRFDEEVFRLELARDRDFRRPRIVESWHPGNLAYAACRSPAVVERFLPQIEEVCIRPLVVVIPLTAPEEILALAAIGQSASDAIPVLQKCAADGNNPKRGCAYYALFCIRSEPADLKSMVGVLRKDEKGPAEMARYLDALGAKARPVADRVPEMLELTEFAACREELESFLKKVEEDEGPVTLMP